MKSLNAMFAMKKLMVFLIVLLPQTTASTSGLPVIAKNAVGANGATRKAELKPCRGGNTGLHKLQNRWGSNMKTPFLKSLKNDSEILQAAESSRLVFHSSNCLLNVIIFTNLVYFMPKASHPCLR